MTGNVTPIEASSFVINIWSVAVYFLTTLIAVFLTAYFSQRALMRDRKLTDRAKLINAIRGLYVEAKSILSFVDPPQVQPMLPLPDDMWRTYKGNTYALSAEAQTKAAQLYTEVQRLNAIAIEDLHKLTHRAGYLDTRYKEQCAVVQGKATELILLLEEWLNQNIEDKHKKGESTETR